MKKLLPVLVLLILFLGTSSCSKGSDTKPANVAYPAPATLTQAQAVSPAPATPTIIIQTPPARTASPTAWPTITAYPKTWQEYPTPNLPPSAWPEYSSEYKYSNRYTLESGFLKYSFRYPPGWYVYPGSTISEPGLEGETYIQNFERIGTDWWYEPQSVGTVKLSLYALPCKHSMDSCPTGLPELVPDLPGHQEVDVISDWTVWRTSLYKRGFVIYLSGYMIGTPEENAELIKTLNKLLSTFVVYDGGIFPPAQTPTPGPTYPVRPLPSAYP